MKSFHWLKLWIEVLDDHKMGTLPDHLWRRVVEAFLLAKSTGSDDGKLPDLAAAAWRLRVAPDELEADWTEIASTSGILECHESGWFVTNFEKRQSKMSAAERQERKRERDGPSSQVSNEPVTECDTEKRREETEQRQSREEAEQSREDMDAAAATSLQELGLTESQVKELKETYFEYTMEELADLAHDTLQRKDATKPIGLFFRRLKDGDRAPPPPDTTPRRFIEGPHADAIQH